MNIFFTADEHYGHENARIGWGNAMQARPFSSLDHMTEELIARHNAVVKICDWVYHIGDMFWRTLTEKQCMDIMRRLNGQHCYVLGNHEERMQCEFGVRAMFRGVYERKESRALGDDNRKECPLIVLDHYAGRVWNGSHRGSWQLHGHSHGMLPDAGLLQMDVGVDCNGFAPVSLEQVRAFMAAQAAKNVARLAENTLMKPLAIVDNRNDNLDYAAWKDI